jgi:hypothetical protein
MDRSKRQHKKQRELLTALEWVTERRICSFSCRRPAPAFLRSLDDILYLHHSLGSFSTTLLAASSIQAVSRLPSRERGPLAGFEKHGGSTNAEQRYFINDLRADEVGHSRDLYCFLGKR